jgi:hypothetical protein
MIYVVISVVCIDTFKEYKLYAELFDLAVQQSKRPVCHTWRRKPGFRNVVCLNTGQWQ